MNFHKLKIVCRIIADINKLQRSAFYLPKNNELHQFILSKNSQLEEETLYTLSKKCEPNPEPLPDSFFDINDTELELEVKNQVYGTPVQIWLTMERLNAMYNNVPRKRLSGESSLNSSQVFG